MKKYAIAIIVAVILGYIGMNSTTNKSSLIDKTNEYNNWVYDKCFDKWFSQSGTQMMDTWPYLTDSRRYKQATDCWQSQRKLTPDDLFLTLPKSVVDSGQCSISQGEDDHVNKARGGMYATDLACNFSSQGVYAPDYLDQMIEYTIESTGSDNLLWNFVILWFKESNDVRWYFWHTVLVWWLKIGDTITTWTRFGKADLSWATTGFHTHIELRRMYDGIWQSVRYVTRGKERKLEEKRLSQKAGVPTYYFTHYDLGVVAQNDASPCIGSSWKDLCYLARTGVATMALTSDIRNQMWVSFGDKVRLAGDEWCTGTYQVEDEMNIRFRQTPWVLRPGTNFYIKWDLPGRPGGACTVTKI